MSFLKNPLFWALLTKFIVVVAFIAFARRKARGSKLFFGTLYFYYGTFTFVALAFHTGYINLRAMRGIGVNHAAHFEYNFHYYALMLLGTVVVFQGIKIMRSAARFINGDKKMLKTIVHSALILLAVNIPLVPLQPGSIWIIGLSVLSLICIASSRVKVKKTRTLILPATLK